MRLSVAIAVLCLALVPETTRAQAFGVVGGATLGEINVKGNEPANVVLTDKLEGMGGVFAAFDLTRHVSFEPEVLLVGRGTRLDFAGVNQSVRLSYLDVPLLVRLSPSQDSPISRLRLTVGPYLGYLFDARTRSHQGGRTSPVDEAFRRADWGWVAGVGVNLGAVDLDARYSGGLADIARRDGALPLPSGNVEALRNRWISLMGRYKF